jgi:hypothetical protein
LKKRGWGEFRRESFLRNDLNAKYIDNAKPTDAGTLPPSLFQREGVIFLKPSTGISPHLMDGADP